MSSMGANDDVPRNGPIYSEPAKSRAELLRRIDEIWERRHEIEPERTPAMKELVDSQDEYRERIRESVRKITGREPRWR